ncbi:MAG TPA: amidophosphoribosyltransferase [bacterium (Candidatus Stahlbacteria)]|nr:amidophosphoribosyltransferase [Candidatus Stahlbacteria bacterium]
MCGVVGIFGEGGVVESVYTGLLAIQHRGQDSAGITTLEDGFHLKKGNGLVLNVFNAKNMARLKGRVGIGHVRYPTIGGLGTEDAQPFIVNTPFGIALAHNGNLVNFFSLRERLIQEDFRYLNSHCDAEVILNIFAQELSREDLRSIRPEAIFSALGRTYDQLIGSYSVVAIIARVGILGFRDPNGIKPLVLGRRDRSFAIASESVVFDHLGYELTGDIGPGEAVFIDLEGRLARRRIRVGVSSPCIFEYVYFARPDSILDEIPVYEARLRLGQELAEAIKRSGIEPDVVFPVPDTARASVTALAESLGIKHREGLIKNRYIGRAFIMPTQKERKVSIRFKLNPIRSEIKGRRVLVVDDSIVRGNTAAEIIRIVRSAGASAVYYASYSPPLRYPCLYGIDMQTRGEFIARDKTIAEVERSIGADRLIYQTVEGLIRGVGASRSFCTGCFTGSYPTEIPEEMALKIEAQRMKVRGEV